MSEKRPVMKDASGTGDAHDVLKSILIARTRQGSSRASATAAPSCIASKSGGVNGILSFAYQTLNNANLSAAQLATGVPGFIVGGNGLSGAPFVIQALQQVTTVHVLSSPEIMVLDNQSARLQVSCPI